MEKTQQSNYPSLASENFGHGRKHYFIDIKKAANDTHFLLITSSEKYQNEDKFYRQTVQLWEEDLGMFVEGLSMVLRRLAHGDLPAAAPALKLVKGAAGMQAIALEERPREKLHALGANALSNAELLAILFCTGSSDLSVLDLCKKVMRSVKNDPSRLLTRTAEDLCKFKGWAQLKRPRCWRRWSWGGGYSSILNNKFFKCEGSAAL